MSFWNEAFYFEKRGDRYVYRPSVLSAGYTVSPREKEELFEGLNRLNWRCSLEGGILVVLIAAVFMTGMIATGDPINWFLFSSIFVVAASAVTYLYRRDRLTSRILGQRSADVPRLPLAQALARPRPIVSKRYAVLALRSTTILLGLAVAAGDALVVYLIFSAYRAGLAAEGAEEMAAVERFVSLTLNNPSFWLVVAAFNAVLLMAIVFSIRRVRQMRALPENT